MEIKKRLLKVIAWALLGVLAFLIACAISVSLIHYKARQGNAQAQATLGYMYFSGTGVEQDRARSIGCFALAASSAVKEGVGHVIHKTGSAVKKVGRGLKHVKNALLSPLSKST